MEKVIIIEGCDASGKSTLASQIMQKYPNYMYIHNAVTDDIQSLHENTIDVAMGDEIIYFSKITKVGRDKIISIMESKINN